MAGGQQAQPGLVGKVGGTGLRTAQDLEFHPNINSKLEIFKKVTARNLLFKVRHPHLLRLRNKYTNTVPLLQRTGRTE